MSLLHHKIIWLIRRFGVLTSRREKEAGQGRQQGFSSRANVVNKLEKARITRQFFLRYASSTEPVPKSEIQVICIGTQISAGVRR